MSAKHEEILASAIPGSEYNPPRKFRFRGLTEMPWKYWRGSNTSWAAYSVVGNHLGNTVVKAIRAVHRFGLTPLIVVRSNDELAAVAERYSDLYCHIAFPIGGLGVLIPPLPVSTRTPQRPAETTRIPRELLGEILDDNGLPVYLRVAMRRLSRTYDRILEIADQPSRDRAEKKALMDFMRKLFRQMGFLSAARETPEMIHRLESAGWGSPRDHFFHSFQNYFFGLLAISKLPSYFKGYRDTAKLHWDIDVFHIWLFTALWHDVGYGIACIGDVNDDLIGSDFGEQVADDTRTTYLRQHTIQEAMLKICSLIARLLKPSSARTEWMPPQGWPRAKGICSIRKALENCFMTKGHGSASALRLYADWAPAIEHLGEEKQRILGQTVLMACASLPLHDSHFRTCLREAYGSFAISTSVMPFAALISFIDSIQDDRRDLECVSKEIRFLEHILVGQPATVQAIVNKDALKIESLLWKVVEVRDVVAHLNQSPESLFFKYPTWMIQ